MSQPNVVVLGSGMAGLGATHRLHAEGITPVIYDKNSYHGGHTASFRSDSGFMFDLGPHISYTKDPRMQDLLADSVDQRYETLKINLNNYWRGYWPKHPVQQHLHGLPEDIIVKVIADFVQEQHAPDRTINNYEDWLLASFGRTFAEEFPMRYTRKYHTTTADNMSTAWLGPRFYRPSLEEVLRGALSPAAPTVHYINNFRYPSDGGFVRYLTKFLPKGRLNLNHELVKVDAQARQLFFANGEVASYDALVSSVPLPELIPMIAGVPANVVEAVGRLACTSCVLVNIGVNREDLSTAQMTYIYDEDICFTRVGYPAHALGEERASRNRQHPGGGLLLQEVPALLRKARGLDRAGDRRSAPLRHPARGRPGAVQAGDDAEVREHHFRPGSRSGPRDRARVPRRDRRELRRPLRRVGLPVDGRSVQERGGSRSESHRARRVFRARVGEA